MRTIKGVMLAGVFHHPGATIPADAMTDAMLARARHLSEAFDDNAPECHVAGAA